jgi:hypothetical protein
MPDRGRQIGAAVTVEVCADQRSGAGGTHRDPDTLRRLQTARGPRHIEEVAVLAVGLLLTARETEILDAVAIEVTDAQGPAEPGRRGEGPQDSRRTGRQTQRGVRVQTGAGARDLKDLPVIPSILAAVDRDIDRLVGDPDHQVVDILVVEVSDRQRSAEVLPRPRRPGDAVDAFVEELGLRNVESAGTARNHEHRTPVTGSSRAVRMRRSVSRYADDQVGVAVTVDVTGREHLAEVLAVGDGSRYAGRRGTDDLRRTAVCACAVGHLDVPDLGHPAHGATGGTDGQVGVSVTVEVDDRCPRDGCRSGRDRGERARGPDGAGQRHRDPYDRDNRHHLQPTHDNRPPRDVHILTMPQRRGRREG